MSNPKHLSTPKPILNGFNLEIEILHIFHVAFLETV